MDHCDLSIVIVSWNAKRLLHDCLQSIATGLCRFSGEVIVVDNGSTDGSPTMVESEFPDVRLIRNQNNIGFAAANNIGIRHTKGRYLALINSDVVVLAGCFDRLLEHMELQPEVGIIGPKILWPDKTLQNSCRKFPGLWNNFCTVTGLRLLFPKSAFFSGEHMRYFAHDSQRCVDYLVGCFLVVRRSAVDQVGLLDEQFFIYAEEVDWCKRFSNAKWRVLFFPEAKAIHVGQGSSSNEPVRFAAAQEKAVLQYWVKHHSVVAVTLLYLLKLLRQVGGLVVYLILYFVPHQKREERKRCVTMHARCLRTMVRWGFDFCRGTIGPSTKTSAGY
jgi:GT2 family glycosyltransferase